MKPILIGSAEAPVPKTIAAAAPRPAIHVLPMRTMIAPAVVISERMPWRSDKRKIDAIIDRTGHCAKEGGRYPGRTLNGRRRNRTEAPAFPRPRRALREILAL